MANKYCPNCGYANAAERGACLMCHAALPAVAVEEGQQPTPTADAPPGLEAMAAVLIEAAEGSLGGMAGTEHAAEAPEEYEMVGLEDVSAAEPAEEAAGEAEEEYIPPPPPPGAVGLEEEEETAEAVAVAAEQQMPEAPPAPPTPEEVFDVDEPAAEEEAEEGAGDEWTIGGD
ncbi:MAG: hypothetical protein KAW89_06595 [Armatimonadetes bacterium]|nr:hypothetical protein [Armatimonadota bacterium]